ncbi:XdhC family protein [Fusobacterium perfoetens]|uniref:XdhC family protein n=1 Tax=Fusobacterium perfoetens TaxID=852 RepID=UPI0015A01D08|nr:XdhC/CoxI family protein [Fusobacterium perfoetens]MCF2625665.1 XdhC family protein [Fusobacterium perfoetens]
MEGKILKAVSDAVEKGIEVAVVTVLEVKGSSPGKEGSMMAVFSDGSIIGTVGGGALEYEIIQESLKAINKNSSCEKSFELTETGNLHMKCGGFIRVYIKIFAKREKLLIMGGGHLGAELYTLGKFLNKYVVIFDDREEFINKERFPKADELIFGKMEETVKNYSIDENSYIIIVTRGHENDKQCLKAILDKKISPKYIGMVGSKGKVISTYKELLSEGYSKEELKEIYSPIGLDISNSEPKEIALGIMAEIIAVKNKKIAIHMKDIRKIDVDNLI